MALYECNDCERRSETPGRCSVCGGRMQNISVLRD
ncbi:rubrerythrin-like domain-containing protein [Halomarina oriensis]|uniref:Rubrerythrin-like domain-containing protein n=1 Tax=Halomarina oriensis TaxID=671145 RepID=A0A6B0GKA6_9EURY|nr:rubrerythrin-like domain-containing protein [Halomarina oriensis]MWG35050.1 rubrerythrin-like domain-containing protein [Halomarina oriensis]